MQDPLALNQRISELESFATLYRAHQLEQYNELERANRSVLMDQRLYEYGRLPPVFPYMGNPQELLPQNNLKYYIQQNRWNGMKLTFHNVENGPLLASEQMIKRLLEIIYYDPDRTTLEIRVSASRCYFNGVFQQEYLVIFRYPNAMADILFDLQNNHRLWRFNILQPTVEGIPYHFNTNLPTNYETIARKIRLTFKIPRDAINENIIEDIAPTNSMVYFLKELFPANAMGTPYQGLAFVNSPLRYLISNLSLQRNVAQLAASVFSLQATGEFKLNLQTTARSSDRSIAEANYRLMHAWDQDLELNIKGQIRSTLQLLPGVQVFQREQQIVSDSLAINEESLRQEMAMYEYFIDGCILSRKETFQPQNRQLLNWNEFTLRNGIYTLPRGTIGIVRQSLTSGPIIRIQNIIAVQPMHTRPLPPRLAQNYPQPPTPQRQVYEDPGNYVDPVQEPVQPVQPQQAPFNVNLEDIRQQPNTNANTDVHMEDTTTPVDIQRIDDLITRKLNQFQDQIRNDTVGRIGNLREDLQQALRTIIQEEFNARQVNPTGQTQPQTSGISSTDIAGMSQKSTRIETSVNNVMTMTGAVQNVLANQQRMIQRIIDTSPQGAWGTQSNHPQDVLEDIQQKVTSIQNRPINLQPNQPVDQTQITTDVRNLRSDIDTWYAESSNITYTLTEYLKDLFDQVVEWVKEQKQASGAIAQFNQSLPNWNRNHNNRNLRIIEQLEELNGFMGTYIERTSDKMENLNKGYEKMIGEAIKVVSAYRNDIQTEMKMIRTAIREEAYPKVHAQTMFHIQGLISEHQDMILSEIREQLKTKDPIIVNRQFETTQYQYPNNLVKAMISKTKGIPEPVEDKSSTDQSPSYQDAEDMFNPNVSIPVPAPSEKIQKELGIEKNKEPSTDPSVSKKISQLRIGDPNAVTNEPDYGNITVFENLLNNSSSKERKFLQSQTDRLTKKLDDDIKKELEHISTQLEKLLIACSPEETQGVSTRGKKRSKNSKQPTV